MNVHVLLAFAACCDKLHMLIKKHQVWSALTAGGDGCGIVGYHHRLPLGRNKKVGGEYFCPSFPSIVWQTLWHKHI